MKVVNKKNSEESEWSSMLQQTTFLFRQKLYFSTFLTFWNNSPCIGVSSQTSPRPLIGYNMYRMITLLFSRERRWFNEKKVVMLKSPHASRHRCVFYLYVLLLPFFYTWSKAIELIFLGKPEIRYKRAQGIDITIFFMTLIT